ncbi:hypothetical protein OEZ85_014230 [Tetradesmus obliquus]|uniref:aspartate--tRNA ligase n=1 Tax=Tetradesmus obliquus TaxID=3088 RepID=A0ABY8U7K5_TETOB|nr:hypothetical protein OEZ85_014230 [Tetradesmus obliquus]
MSAEEAANLSQELSDKAALKAEKDAKKAAKEARAQQRGVKQAAPTQPDADDPCASQWGDYALVQSQEITGRKWTKVEQLTPELSGQEVLVRGRLYTVRGKGKSAFLMIRQRTATVQAVMFADDVKVSKGMVKYACGIPKESIVDVGGILTCPEAKIESATQKDVELQVTSIRVVSRAAALPFELVDAARSDAEIAAAAEKGEVLASVSQDVRLDNRALDLRTPANQAIFKLQSAVCQLFREAMLSQDFQEIHTPKLIAGASEGGAAVFRFDYMGRPGCLAQSPQLYKQMAICADFDRVFEIGPVFRAENSYTHRHLCEFTGLDFEMAIYEHYFEVLDVIEHLFMHMFNGLATKYAAELEAVQSQYPFEPIAAKPVRLTFAEGIKLLQDDGLTDVDPLGDLNTELERRLGKIVKDKYGTDFYILHRYPMAIRPFYTMPCPDDPAYSNSFDVFIRGEEIISGAQRVHDPELLTTRAVACGIPVDTIQAYIDSFKLGASPHGGCGVGMERVVMLYCGLNNIRKTSMFPRDPKRLEP